MRFTLPLIVLSMLIASPAVMARDYADLYANPDTDRTANRGVGGIIPMPEKFFKLPEHSEFLPSNSNHHPQYDHPQQWVGQDWDPSAWNEKQWTPDIAIRKFYENRTIHKTYLRYDKMPVMEVGPTFYKLSDLDQRRMLKLITDTDGVFEGGFEMVELRDWQDHKVIGSYTRQGLTLN